MNQAEKEEDGMPCFFCLFVLFFCINHVIVHTLKQVDRVVLQESRLIFFECSAFSGHNVIESMVHLARYVSITLH